MFLPTSQNLWHILRLASRFWSVTTEMEITKRFIQYICTACDILDKSTFAYKCKIRALKNAIKLLKLYPEKRLADQRSCAIDLKSLPFSMSIPPSAPADKISNWSILSKYNHEIENLKNTYSSSTLTRSRRQKIGDQEIQFCKKNK